MKAHRHPHPHLDPRQPRHQTRPGTNPPVFAWKPLEHASGYSLCLAHDARCCRVCLALDGLREPLYLPERALAPGRYYWKWAADGLESQVFRFDIDAAAPVVEVPAASEWLRRLPAAHPRLGVRPDEVPALRASRNHARQALWSVLQQRAEELLAQPHELAEPPFLPDWQQDYEKAFRVWARILAESRAFLSGAETLALAYLASGEARYGRAACRRLASVAAWDPSGATHIAHNDEAHMSVLWYGPTACDWAWEQFTDEERRAVVEQFRARGQITFDYMHNRGSYGVTRFDSHAGREIVFLACTALALHEHIPEAGAWLEWLRPVLAGIWPIWAGDDGAWAEGPDYGLAYVRIMTRFATALKRGTGVDLYRRPFWGNHARWRRDAVPPDAEIPGFGDVSRQSAGTLRAGADLVETIARETGAADLREYVAALRRAAAQPASARSGSGAGDVDAQRYLAPPAAPDAGGTATGGGETEGSARADRRLLRVYAAAGQAILHTHPEDPERDVALAFRSSPYGAISHSHAANNDFILHVAGRALALPSGYYAGYGSDHHTHWQWHAKAHNCVTLSDAPQLMRSHDSAGAVENAFEDERLVYFRGNADASYRDRALRCRRHVLFLKTASAFVLADEFVARPGVASALQWNLHSWAPFVIDAGGRRFTTERDGRVLHGHVMYHANGFFSSSAGWDPPPLAREGVVWPPQYHLRFTCSGLAARRNLGVVLCPEHAGLRPAEVRTEGDAAAERAWIGGALVLLGQGAPLEHDGWRTDALLLAVVDGARYEIADGGVRAAAARGA